MIAISTQYNIYIYNIYIAILIPIISQVYPHPSRSAALKIRSAAPSPAPASDWAPSRSVSPKLRLEAIWPV